MNWRDSIWAQTRSRGRRSRCVKLATQRLVPYSENKGYASNPRCFLLFVGCVKNVSPVSSNMYINHTVLKRQLAQWVQVKSCTNVSGAAF